MVLRQAQRRNKPLRMSQALFSDKKSNQVFLMNYFEWINSNDFFYCIHEDLEN